MNSLIQNLTANTHVRLLTEEGLVPLQNLERFPKNFWLDIEHVSEPILNTLEEIFDLHSTFKKDILTETVFAGRVDIYQNYTLVVLPSDPVAQTNSETLTLTPLFIVLVPDGLISLSPGEAPRLINDLWATTITNKTIFWSPQMPVCEILKKISQLLLEEVSNQNNESQDTVELLDTLDVKEYSDLRRRIMSSQSDIFSLRWGLLQHNLILSRLLEHSSGSEQTREKILTIQQAISSGLTSLRRSEELLENTQDSYIAQINIELAESSEYIGRIVLRLTIFSAVMMPLTLITAIFGMNVWYPYNASDTSSFVGFSVIIGLMVISTITTILGLWKMDWFG